MMILNNWQPSRWAQKGVVVVLAALAVLAVIPFAGVAVLNYQANKCSVHINSQQRVLHGHAWEQFCNSRR